MTEITKNKDITKQALEKVAVFEKGYLGLNSIFQTINKSLAKSFRKSKRYHKILDKWESVISVLERNKALTEREKKIFADSNVKNKIPTNLFS